MQFNIFAVVAELVDAGDLKSPGKSRAGSTPAFGIIFLPFLQYPKHFSHDLLLAPFSMTLRAAHPCR